MHNLKVFFLVSGVTLLLGSLGLLAYHYIMFADQLMRLLNI